MRQGFRTRPYGLVVLLTMTGLSGCVEILSYPLLLRTGNAVPAQVASGPSGPVKATTPRPTPTPIPTEDPDTVPLPQPTPTPSVEAWTYVQGTVKAEGGALLDGAEVVAFGHSPLKFANGRESISTKTAAGAFRLDGVPVGAVLLVHCQKSGYQGQSMNLTAAAVPAVAGGYVPADLNKAEFILPPIVTRSTSPFRF